MAALTLTTGLGGCAIDPVWTAADEGEMAQTSPDEIVIDSEGRVSAVYRLGTNTAADRVIVGTDGQLTFVYQLNGKRRVRTLPDDR